MKKILIIDDDLEIRKLVKDFLIKENFEVSTAKNGTEAFNMITDSTRKYHLIVLDLILPDISCCNPTLIF